MKVAFFDFDGTITTKDSLIDFIQFAVGKRAYYRGLVTLSPMLLSCIVKLISNDRAKEKMLAYYFQGWQRTKFEKIASRYALEQIDQIVRPDALAKLQWHREQGHRVVMVSASMAC